MSSHRLALLLGLLGGLAACSAPATRPAPETTTVSPGVDTTTAPPGGGGSGGEPVTCDFDHFVHALGGACNRASDCASGLCQLYLDTNDNVVGYCSLDCTSQACPSGFTCGANEEGQRRCLVDDAATLGPANGSLVAGEPCVTSADCAGGARCALMGNLDGSSSSFCAPPCGPTGPSCGACGTCENFGTLTEPTYLCVPKGPGAVGAACDSHFACSSFLCVGFCTALCAPSVPCPTGSSCTPVNDNVSLCVTPDRLRTGAAGSPCAFDLECIPGTKCRSNASGTGGECRPPTAQGGACTVTSECAQGLRCLPGEAGTARTCVPPSGVGGVCLGDDSNCAQGLTCRDLGPDLSACTKNCSDDVDCGVGGACGVVELDTRLRLFATVADAKAGRTLSSSDDSPLGDGDLYSHLDPVSLEPGTYLVAVETYQAYLGAYELRVTVDGQTPSAEFELPESPTRNDLPDEAQPLLGFPVVLSGVIDSGADVDFFAVTVPPGASVTVRIEVGRGAPSACFPASKVAKGAIGAACDHGAYCASAHCTYELGICGQSCTDDVSCGDASLACVTIGSKRSCVPAAMVGALARDGECRFDFECAEGSCVSFDGDRFCSVRCVEPDVDCGTTHECATITEYTDVGVVRTPTCVPEGDRTKAFNVACVRQSDCLSGSACVGGRCSPACQQDTDCPAQDFPPTPVVGRFDCAPCSTTLDCGDGICLTGVGFERYCADVCGANDACPSGFRCVDLWGKYCVPDHGSCRRPTCSTEAGGRCVVPASAYAEACRADGDCATGACEGGICTKSCATSADCGCAAGDLVCDGTQCVVSPSYAAEVEPDDEPASAVVVAVPSTVMGAFETSAGRKDVDQYRLTLTAGTTLDVVTRPVCGIGALRLDPAMTLSKDGVVVAEDDISDWYGSLSYAVPTSGEYLLAVRDDGWGTVTAGRYVLELKTR